jgi:hypothetical protein
MMANRTLRRTAAALVISQITGNAPVVGFGVFAEQANHSTRL